MTRQFTKGRHMPMVRVSWVTGRSAEQKKQLAARITVAVAEIGDVSAKNVWVVFDDVDPQNWAVEGRLVDET
ncbi:tautomerase family protein [Mycobacterium sp. URHB0021]